MLAKDLIAELQKLPPDTKVCALTPEKHLSSLLSVWEAYPYGRHTLQIVGVGERLCNTYKVQYVEDDCYSHENWVEPPKKNNEGR